VNWKRISSRDVYKGEVVAVRVRTRPEATTTLLKVTAPNARVPIHTELEHRDGSWWVYRFTTVWEGEYTIGVVAKNAAGQHADVETKRIHSYRYPRDEKNAQLTIRLENDPAYAGQDVTVRVEKIPAGSEVRYGVGRPGSPTSAFLGTSRNERFTFNTRQARSELRRSGTYELRASIKTPGGRLLKAVAEFSFKAAPKLELVQVIPDSAKLSVPRGEESVITMMATNTGSVDFEGYLRVAGPFGFKFSVDRKSVSERNPRNYLTVPANSSRQVHIEVRAPYDYDTGQMRDKFGTFSLSNMSIPVGPTSSVAGVESALKDFAGGDLVTVTACAADGAEIAELAYDFIWSGEVRTGRLEVSVRIDPHWIGEVRVLKPGTKHRAVFTVRNTGKTLMWITDQRVDWPDCIKTASEAHPLSFPKPWKTTPGILHIMEGLLSALEDITSTAKGPYVEVISDAYLTKYFLNFMRLAKVGLPLPAKEALVFEVQFEADKEGIGAIGFNVGYHDSGATPPYDYGSGYSTAAQAAMKWSKDLLRKDYTPIGKLAKSEAPIKVAPWYFSREIDSILGPLGDAPHRLGVHVGNGIGYVARIKCPADLHLYDSKGRHVGVNYKTGRFENTIPEAQRVITDQGEYILIPNTLGNIIAVVKGRDRGAYNLDIIRPVMTEQKNGRLERLLVPFSYRNVPCEADSTRVHRQDVVAIGRAASAKLGQMDVESAIRAAMKENADPAAAPTARPSTWTGWRRPVLWAGIVVGIVLLGLVALMIRLKRKPKRLTVTERDLTSLGDVSSDAYEAGRADALEKGDSGVEPPASEPLEITPEDFRLLPGPVEPPASESLEITPEDFEPLPGPVESKPPGKRSSS